MDCIKLSTMPKQALPTPGDPSVKWYLEMGKNGEFVAKYKTVRVKAGGEEEREEDVEVEVEDVEEVREVEEQVRVAGETDLTIGKESVTIVKRGRGRPRKVQQTTGLSEVSTVKNVVGDVSRMATPDDGGGLGGKSMTMWWLRLSVATALNGTLLLELFAPELEWTNPHESILQRVIYALRGCCAASALCVCLGYYTFVILMAVFYKTNLIHQLYVSTKSSVSMSFLKYLMLDVAVHLFATTSLYNWWREYISTTSIFLAFVFHRWWSLWNSGFRSTYFRGDQIYLFPKPASPWLWYSVWVVESVVLASLLRAS